MHKIHLGHKKPVPTYSDLLCNWSYGTIWDLRWDTHTQVVANFMMAIWVGVGVSQGSIIYKASTFTDNI